MKKRTIILGLMASMVMTTGCTNQGTGVMGNSVNLSSSTDEAQEQVQVNSDDKIVYANHDIYIDSNVDEVLDALGEPAFANTDSEIEFYTYNNAEIEMHVFDDGNSRDIWEMHIMSNKVSTNRGIKSGDSKDAVLEKYGKPDEESHDANGDTYTYDFDGYKLSFVTDDNNESVQRFFITNEEIDSKIQ